VRQNGTEMYIPSGMPDHYPIRVYLQTFSILPPACTIHIEVPC